MKHIVSIAHTAYFVRDMEASLDFYCNKLGMEHAFSIHDDNGNPWIEYLKVVPGQFVELFYPAYKMEEAPGSYSHLCLQVDDCKACIDDLIKEGVTIDTMPNQGKDFNWQAWVKDPDGNRIEIMQIVPESPQAKA